MNRIKFIPLLLLCAGPLYAQQVKVTTETVTLPTYQIAPPEADPIFFTGRVSQGAEGYLYPYQLYDVLTDQKKDQDFSMLRLDNDYVDIMVAPQLGGRIFAAEDKGNAYQFFYKQSGIKPSLIGMLGAWLSGGVEWNVPDHHRASSYMNVDWTVTEDPDGSKTVWVGEMELRHRLKWSVGVSVHPGRSWVEARVKVTNPTPMIQSMLYWANVSVHCDEAYQVIFPPDVQFGSDHHKVYFTRWPRGESVIGKGDDVDLSWWKNYTGVSRSIFAWGSEMSFLAGYDFSKDAGTVHVANRHVVKGKKFFLWGNNAIGGMWNKILSDKDGNYLELMAGAYSDNQPDYSWIAPGEMREFSQIWYPIKGIKGVKNATDEAAVNFSPAEDGTYLVGYCSTTSREGARVVVMCEGKPLMDKKINIDPDHYFLDNVAIPAGTDPSKLYTALYDSEGALLVDYTPVVLDEKPLPEVIEGAKGVDEYKTVEELYLAGLRVDQLNNARLDYMDYYRAALRIDPSDARVNIEVGKHYIRQGEWAAAEEHLLRAQARLAHDYTNVKNTEALYYLGYVYQMTGRDHEAVNSYWAATWTPEFKHRCFYELSVISARGGDFKGALDLVNQSLYVGSRDVQALTLKAFLLRKLGKEAQASEVLHTAVEINPLDYWSAAEASFIKGQGAEFLREGSNHNAGGVIGVQQVLEVAITYLTLGAEEDALSLLNGALSVGAPYSQSPLLQYYKAVCLAEKDRAEAVQCVSKARTLPLEGSFPLRLEEVPLFEKLISLCPEDATLHYQLGNLLYYLGQKEKGLGEWERSTALSPDFAQGLRNVGFGYGRKGEYPKAIEYYDRSVKAFPGDPLIYAELDRLCEKARIPVKECLSRLEAGLGTVMRYDDAVMRLLSLYVADGQLDKALKILDTRHFHVWEGGGEVHNVYVNTHLLKGVKLLEGRHYGAALREFDLARAYPSNLEVAPSPSTGYEAKIDYLSGLALESMGKQGKARESFLKSASSEVAAGGSDLIYYKILSLRKLGESQKATQALSDFRAAVSGLSSASVDTYAKFGSEEDYVQQSNACYLSGLVSLLDGDRSAAEASFSKAVEINPRNAWARGMMK